VRENARREEVGSWQFVVGSEEEVGTEWSFVGREKNGTESLIPDF
jgi:hypothetical protein